jgi:hypothetical protein
MTEECLSEIEGLATLRIHRIGQRSLVLFRTDDIRAYVKDKEKKDCTSTIPAQRIFNFVEQLNAVEAKSFIAKGHDIWHVTLGLHDIIYVPAGFQVHEKCIDRQNDVLGYRCSVISVKDKNAVAFFEEELSVLKKSNQKTVVASEILGYLGHGGATNVGAVGSSSGTVVPMAGGGAASPSLTTTNLTGHGQMQNLDSDVHGVAALQKAPAPPPLGNKATPNAFSKATPFSKSTPSAAIPMPVSKTAGAPPPPEAPK